jgi:hypothetical protein
MAPLLLLLSLNMVSTAAAPTGTELHIRLTTPVGSYASKPGMPVKAVLIAPVHAAGGTLLPAGSIVSGTVKSVTRVGLGIVHETARLDLQFRKVVLLNGKVIPISAQVFEVDNGREKVGRNGRIEGLRSTAGLCYRVSGYIRTALQWQIHAELAEWVIKSLIMQMPEPEIYYPPGAELTLKLTGTLPLHETGISQTQPGQLTCEKRAELRNIVESIPTRTYSPASSRPSDLTNVLLVGSREEIETAFRAAGWSEAQPASLRRSIRWIRAAAESRGDGEGPMSRLLLNGADADMAWQKGLNDVSKRHHVRVWRQPETWYGQEVWAAAGTRDIDFAYLRPGHTLTHKIDRNVDEERDKIAYDLEYTKCARVLGWIERPDVPFRSSNGTGDPMVTDTRMAVVKLSSCEVPRLADYSISASSITPRGGKWQRFLRREILGMRSDLIRDNLYWRVFEGSRLAVDYVRLHRLRTRNPEPSWEAKSLSKPNVPEAPTPAKADPGALVKNSALNANASNQETIAPWQPLSTLFGY